MADSELGLKREEREKDEAGWLRWMRKAMAKEPRKRRGPQ